MKSWKFGDRVGLMAGLLLIVLSAGAGVPTGASAQTLTTLHSFTGSDGENPHSGVIFDASGALYGTTAVGGAYGYGTVYKLAPPSVSGGAWTETILHSFNGSDGSVPYATLISDAQGALYGTTYSGGLAGGAGQGVVYKLTPPATTGGNWTESLLYVFSNSDGSGPTAGLLSDASGALYGATYYGGSTGQGTIFRLTPHNPANPNSCEVANSANLSICQADYNSHLSTCTPGDPICVNVATAIFNRCNQSAAAALASCTPVADDETLLYSFTGIDGSLPNAALIADASGILYGTTLSGGAYGSGLVFKLTPPATTGGNWAETPLYSFTGGNDGTNPSAALITDASGALYGTTESGGIYGYGTVFKLTPPAGTGSWTESVLYSFTGAGDGFNPLSGLLFDASGALYGTTVSGGIGASTTNTGYGTIFKLTPPTATGGKWTKAVLHNFSGSDGAQPSASLIPDASGALYGTTANGGGVNYGTVFQLTLPAIFTGVPGKANCTGQSISFMAKKYGGTAHAAESLGYTSVAALQNAVLAYCGGS